MAIQTIGIIGHGAFGKFLEEAIGRFAPGITLRIHAQDAAPDGKRFFSLSDAAACDAVILAVPIHAFASVLDEVVAAAGSHTVIVDICTVKTYTVGLLKEKAAGRPWLACHPMFGPESYAKTGGDVDGFRIIVTDDALPAGAYDALRHALAVPGFMVIRMGSDEHDKHLAESLFLTHFIGQMISRGGFDRTAIDSVSFGFLMQAVESVKNDTALFKDVFTYDPYCAEILDRLEKAEAEVRGILEKKTDILPS